LLDITSSDLIPVEYGPLRECIRDLGDAVAELASLPDISDVTAHPWGSAIA